MELKREEDGAKRQEQESSCKKMKLFGKYRALKKQMIMFSRLLQQNWREKTKQPLAVSNSLNYMIR